MRDCLARAILGVACAVFVACALAADLPALSGGRFWGDGATYYTMAWSLAEDGDLRYQTQDLLRVKREFASGPEGIFLKRASGGLRLDPVAGFPWISRVPESEPRIYFAKPFVYSAAAAPFVKLLGTRGLLVTNALCLALTLCLGYAELRRRAAPGSALALCLVLVLATVAPVYLVWPTPELFNMALVAAGLWAWSRDRPLLSAVLLGVATYSKPYNLWLALPLGVAPLVAAGPSLRRRLLESTRRGAVLGGSIAMMFVLNAGVTGEANYQGGRERKTFYGKFPGETEIADGRPRDVTFGNSGVWMSTNALGPRVAGKDDLAPAQGAEPPRSADEIRASFVRNLGYFWIGRFGGAVPYFFPVVLAGVAFLVAGPREPRGWLALASLAVSWLFYLCMIPDNWYGGSGTLGNRYFLNLVPLGVFLAPRGRERVVAALGLVGSLVFIGPILASPFHNSIHHGAHATGRTFRALPAELTMLNDLAVFTEPWRKKQPVGDTEGDRWRNWPADPKAYYLYFPDDGTYGREEGAGGSGFWLRGGASAEVFLRALEPVRTMKVRVTGGPAGDDVTVRVGGRTGAVVVGPGESHDLRLGPGEGFVYKDSFVYVLNLTSRRGGRIVGASGDPRELGAFVAITLEVRQRPRVSGQSPFSFRRRASSPLPILRQRETASDSRSFWRAVAVMGRCWHARFTHAIGSLDRRCWSRKPRSSAWAWR